MERDRDLENTKKRDNGGLKCAIDHILDAQKKGEISEDNVLYIVENINVAGKLPSFTLLFCAQNKYKMLIEGKRKAWTRK